jgi:hypothetical protein
VVIEDYVHGEMVKLGTLMLSSGACLVGALACALSVLFVTFGG